MSSDSDLKELKRRLKKSSDFKQLTDTISNIISTQSKQDFNFMKKALPLLKKLLFDLIDASWAYTKQLMESSLPQATKHIRHITSVPRLNCRNKVDNKMTWSTEQIPNESKAKDDRITSEFTYIKGAARFPKSIREINKVRAPSPGPDFYYFDTLRNKNRSPRVIFPKSAAERNSYIPNSLSPGPCKYYSSIRYLTKHS
jgi:hypothetical protein